VKLSRRDLLVGGGCLLACNRGIERMQAHLVPPSAPIAAASVQVTWLGTAGVRIDDGRTALLIDPFVTRVGVGAVIFGRPLDTDIDAAHRVDLGGVAAVLVSHSHYDHLVDAPWFAAATGAELCGSASTVAVGRAAALPPAQLHEVVVGQPRRYGDFVVTFLDSRHGPALAGRVPFPGHIDEDIELPAAPSEYRMGGAFGIVVEHPAGTLVHHASASWVDGMYDGISADVVLLGLAGRKDTLAYLEAVVDPTGARVVVPIHWDDFFRDFDRPLKTISAAHVREFFDTVQAARPDLAIRALPLLEPRGLLTGTQRRARPVPG
jgi:L-ascorbate metabolism protein UlaG (beta-lactamase superfamily)